MDIVLLGSGGWIPTSKRETCSALIREGAHVLVIDAGTGLARLVERPELLEGAEQVDIVLTHFHLDHVTGLSYLPGLPIARPPTVWGPGELNFETRTVDVLDRLLGPPLFAASAGELTSGVHELVAGENEIGRFRLSTRVQERHNGPTLALRVGDALAYCTDTAADPANVDFATGVEILFHEAWHAAAATEDSTHTASGEAGRIAAEAGAGRLVLIHVSPLLAAEEELLRDARAEFPATVVGADLMRF
jgi:ribonuclease BN (tRNA processing enzyme)